MTLLYSLFMQLIAGYSKVIYVLLCLLNRIAIRDNMRLYGVPLIIKRKGSCLNIGRNCVLRSKSYSNLIGINRPCMFSTLASDAELIIGDNCGFSGTVIGAFRSIKIGNSVRCGANTLITDSDWHLDDPRSGEAKPIVICDNVWLGEGVKVLKGVIIGENTVIGAGSVVTKSIPANVIAAGNPCKIIRNIYVN